MPERRLENAAPNSASLAGHQEPEPDDPEGGDDPIVDGAVHPRERAGSRDDGNPQDARVAKEPRASPPG
jgi:hypothetical protein